MATYDDDSLVRKAREAATIKGESDVEQANVAARGKVEEKAVENLGKIKLQREQIAARDLEISDAAMGDWRSYRASKDKAFDPALVATKAQELAATGDARGDMGVQNPVHVIRRMKSTYAGGAPGEEFSNATRAMQGINRYYGIGEYVSPDVAKQEALALKDPKKVEEANAAKYSLLMNQLTRAYGVPNKETGKIELHPELDAKLHQDLLAGKDIHDPAYLQDLSAIGKDITLRDSLNDPKKLHEKRADLAKNFDSLKPEEKKAILTEFGAPDEKTAKEWIKTKEATPANLHFFKRVAGAKGVAPAVTGPAGAPGTVAAPAVPSVVQPVGSAEEAAAIGVTRPTPPAPGAPTYPYREAAQEIINNPIAAAGRGVGRAAVVAGQGIAGAARQVAAMGPEGMSNPTGMPLEMSPGEAEAWQQHQLGLEVLRAQAKHPQEWTDREKELMWLQRGVGGPPAPLGIGVRPRQVPPNNWIE